MLILEYISTHGTPEWCAARMSARASKGPLPAYEQLFPSCTGVYWLYAWPEGPTPAGDWLGRLNQPAWATGTGLTEADGDRGRACPFELLPLGLGLGE